MKNYKNFGSLNRFINPYVPKYYGVTLTKDTKVVNHFESLYDEFVDDMQLLKEINKVTNLVELCPEFTLNKTLHYHMIVCITDQIGWNRKIISNWKKERGFVHITHLSTNSEIDHFRKYILKDCDKMCEELVINKLPLTRDFFDKENLFDEILGGQR